MPTSSWPSRRAASHSQDMRERVRATRPGLSTRQLDPRQGDTPLELGSSGLHCAAVSACGGKEVCHAPALQHPVTWCRWEGHRAEHLQHTPSAAASPGASLLPRVKMLEKTTSLKQFNTGQKRHILICTAMHSGYKFTQHNWKKKIKNNKKKNPNYAFILIP